MVTYLLLVELFVENKAKQQVIQRLQPAKEDI